MFKGSSNKVKAICIGALIAAQGSVAMAGEPATVSRVRAQLERLKAQNSSSFCYIVEDGQVQGVNADKPVKIASVMKLMTSYWALEKLGSPEFRWKTKIYYQASNKEMHIEGSRDPFFHRDRLYLLLSDLKMKGITSLNRLTADRNFQMGMDVPNISNSTSSAHRNSSQEKISGAELMENFNTANWWKDRKGTYSRIRNENKPKMVQELSLRVEAADVVPSNPLAGKPGVQVFEIQSAPLKYYLKRMNIASANPIADELYFSLGGTQAFRQFIEERHGMGDEVTGVHSGSGYWVGSSNSDRRDTRMSCSAVVRIIRRMDKNLEEKHNMGLADVMMVADLDNQDGATIKNVGGRSLIVKTGTVDGAKNLAGEMLTTQGEVYFGIFMQGGSANHTKRGSVLNSFMSGFNRVAVKRDRFRFVALDEAMQLRSVSKQPPRIETEIVVVANRPKPSEVKKQASATDTKKASELPKARKIASK